MTGVSAMQKRSLAGVFQNRHQACNFIETPAWVFCYEINEIFKNTFFFTEHLYSGGCFWQCKPMKTHWKFMLLWKKWYTWTVLLSLLLLDKGYSFEFFETLWQCPISVKFEGKARSSCPEVFCEKVLLKILQTAVVFLWSFRNFQEHFFS